MPVVVTVSGVPIVIVPLRSLKVLSCIVALPPWVPCGSMSTVYVPAAGKVMESRNAELPQVLVEATELPSGLRIAAFRAMQPV